jgi:hypothetical protein
MLLRRTDAVERGRSGTSRPLPRSGAKCRPVPNSALLLTAEARSCPGSAGVPLRVPGRWCVVRRPSLPGMARRSRALYR